MPNSRHCTEKLPSRPEGWSRELPVVAETPITETLIAEGFVVKAFVAKAVATSAALAKNQYSVRLKHLRCT